MTKQSKEIHREYMKKWSSLNHEKVRKYQKNYKIKNKEKLNTKRLEYERGLRKSVISMLGGKCIICGITDKRVLQVNHIYGNGKKDRLCGIRKMYRRILSGDTKNYDLRCANCNILYEYDKEVTRK